MVMLKRAQIEEKIEKILTGLKIETGIKKKVLLDSLVVYSSYLEDLN